jgi:hypothetical protein
MERTAKNILITQIPFPWGKIWKESACSDLTHENSVHGIVDLNLDEDAAYPEVFRDFTHPY